MKHLIKILRQENGFTLMELTVVTVLLSLLLGTAYFFLFHTSLMTNKEVFRADVHNDIRIAANRISRDIRQAVEILPAGDFTDSPWISVKRVELGTDNIETIKEVKYYLDSSGREIEYAVNDGAGFYGNTPIVNHVKNVKFSKQGGTVTIIIEGEKDNGSKKEIEKGYQLYDSKSYTYTILTKVTPKLLRE